MIERNAMFGTQDSEALSINFKGAHLVESRDGQAIKLKCFFEHVEIETKSIVRDDPLAGDKRLHLRPHPGKGGRLGGGLRCDPVNPDEVPPVVIVGWLDEQAQLTDDDAALDAHESDLADAGAGILRRLEIDGGEVRFHRRELQYGAYLPLPKPFGCRG